MHVQRTGQCPHCRMLTVAQVAAMMLGFMEVVMHTAMIRMFRLPHFYSPGLATAVMLLLPVSLYTFVYVIRHDLTQAHILGVRFSLHDVRLGRCSANRYQGERREIAALYSSGCCDQSVDVITGCALHGQGHRGCKGGLRPFPWLHYGRGEEQIGGSPKIDCLVRAYRRSQRLIPTALFAGHARFSSDQSKTDLPG